MAEISELEELLKKHNESEDYVHFKALVDAVKVLSQAIKEGNAREEKEHHRMLKEKEKEFNDFVEATRLKQIDTNAFLEAIKAANDELEAFKQQADMLLRDNQSIREDLIYDCTELVSSLLNHKSPVKKNIVDEMQCAIQIFDFASKTILTPGKITDDDRVLFVAEGEKVTKLLSASKESQKTKILWSRIFLGIGIGLLVTALLGALAAGLVFAPLGLVAGVSTAALIASSLGLQSLGLGLGNLAILAFSGILFGSSIGVGLGGGLSAVASARLEEHTDKQIEPHQKAKNIHSSIKNFFVKNHSKSKKIDHKKDDTFTKK